MTFLHLFGNRSLTMDGHGLMPAASLLRNLLTILLRKSRPTLPTKFDPQGIRGIQQGCKLA
jgi:hypothetical protein